MLPLLERLIVLIAEKNVLDVAIEELRGGWQPY